MAVFTPAEWYRIFFTPSPDACPAPQVEVLEMIFSRKSLSSSSMSTRPEDLRSRFKWSVDSDREDSEEKMPTREKGYDQFIKLSVSAVSGLIFGMALEKGRVFEPHIIRQQMLFSNFTMLKMFLSASATGMLAFSILTMIPRTSRRMEKALFAYFPGLKYKGVLAAAVGGAFLGMGMTLAGACPGMVLAQVGAGVPNSVLTLAGGICGAFLYALTEPLTSIWFKPVRSYRYNTLDEYLETPYFILALPFAALLGLVVFAAEVFRPWETEVIQSGSGVFGVRAWPPYITGMIIGLLQIPVVLVIQDTLGSSASYVTVASQVLIFERLNRVLPYLKKYTTGIGNWWQVFYVFSAIAGARISATTSNTVGTVEGLEEWYSFGGGVLMIYGARLAGGCTSGHGLSGMGLLVLLSFVAVPSMFAGGISLAFLMKYKLGVAM
ncbi:unnamed protein product [Lymnaea stagnalis]|uniref:Sulphur transport domain-containing protein n=1 Tax=Lymnaea stagnalis TaxID=6523 RepID=A0AAV2H4W7_LYMST